MASFFWLLNYCREDTKNQPEKSSFELFRTVPENHPKTS